MNHSYTYGYDRVRLIPLVFEDIEKMRALRNKNCDSFFNHNQITKEAQETWYQSYVNAENDYIFSVILQRTGQWIGSVSIYHVDKFRECGEFGRLMIDHAVTKERGLGVDTTLAACDFAFQTLALSKVYLEVFADNTAAVRTYERSGFKLCQSRVIDTGRTIYYMEKYSTQKGKV